MGDAPGAEVDPSLTFMLPESSSVESRLLIVAPTESDVPPLRPTDAEPPVIESLMSSSASVPSPDSWLGSDVSGTSDPDC